MEPVRLRSSQLQKAAGIFYKAFLNYPQMVHYFPDSKARERHLQWYLSCVLKYALRYGEVHTNQDVTGFVCWLPPERTAPYMLGYILSGFLMAPVRFGIRKYGRVIECEDYTAVVHKKLMPEPHYYIWGVAVDPTLQGQGVGSELLRPGLEQARAKNLPVYLETHDAKNIHFYEKLGFQMICEDRVPEHNLPFWCFLRQS